MNIRKWKCQTCKHHVEDHNELGVCKAKRCHCMRYINQASLDLTGEQIISNG